MSETQTHREIARIAVPVSLEAIVQLLLGFIDQVIIGALGTVAIAAVGLSNSILTVVLIALGALGAGAGILTARAHGGGRREDLAHTAGAATILSALLAVIVTLPLILAAGPSLRAIGAAPAVAGAARRFLPIVLLCSPVISAGGVASATLRSLGRTGATFTATLVAVFLNTALGYGLVFGIGPLPRLGLTGAACATCVAQMVKSLLLWRLLYGDKHLMPWALPTTPARWQEHGTSLLRLAAPLAAKDISWSFALFGYTLIFQRLGTGILAASQIVTVLENLFFLGSIGLMVAGTTLIGQAIGRGDAALAQLRVQALQRAGVATGLGFGALFMATALLLPVFYPHVGPGVRSVAAGGIVLSAAFQPVRVRNMVLGGGVLPSAGDARAVVIGDGLGAFLVGLPLACLLAFGFHAGPWGVFAARGVEEMSKVFYFSRRARRLPWPEVVAAQGGHLPGAG